MQSTLQVFWICLALHKDEPCNNSIIELINISSREKHAIFVCIWRHNLADPRFYFVTGHKEATWDMRAHLRIQLLATLRSIRTYVDLADNKTAEISLSKQLESVVVS